MLALNERGRGSTPLSRIAAKNRRIRSSRAAGRRVWLACALGLAFGCASSSPFNQSFVEVRTPHFHVTSSLGDGPTRELVRDLEVFHAGVLFAIGLGDEARVRPPTRVLAFDGRGIARPFAVRGAAAFLVPAIDSPILVIRSAGDFDERVDPDLRHRYAHRVLRDLSPARAPLWYEEGRAQIASTIDVAPTGVQVGRTAPELRTQMLDWRRSDWTALLRRTDLSDESVAGRQRFDAQSWALVHTLLFDSDRRRDSARVLDRIRRAFEGREARALSAALEALGTEETLSTRIYAHLERGKHRVDRMRVEGLRAGDLELTPLRPAVARDRLGELAIELGRPAVAKEYFERALRDPSAGAAARAGLAWAVAAGAAGEGQAAAVEAVLEDAASGSDDDARAAFRLGLAWSAWAARAAPGEARDQRIARARSHFERSLSLDSGRASVRVAIGASELEEGGRPAQALEWFEGAQRLAPGALEIDLFLARAELRLGHPRAAAAHLAEVLSRTHGVELRTSAEKWVDRLE